MYFTDRRKVNCAKNVSYNSAKRNTGDPVIHSDPNLYNIEWQNV